MGVQLAVSTARPLSLALVMLSLLVIIIIIARRTNPTSEVEEIRRRFSSLLVRVEPMPTPHGHTVVDVTEPATLAKLAERYGLLILHWTRSNVETFIVQDDATTYRYRASVASPAAQRASGPSR
jgi:hypothetical protein